MKIGKISIEKKSRFNMSRLNLVPKVLGYGVLAFFAFMMINSIPDLKRYIKISTI